MPFCVVEEENGEGMHQCCEMVILRALQRILNTVPNDHPAAALVALWMVENSDLLGAVPQPWNKSTVDPTIWKALSQLVNRRLDTPAEQFSFPNFVRDAVELDPRKGMIEVEFLGFLAACTVCDDFAMLVEMLSDGTGLTNSQVHALCIGATEAEILDILGDVAPSFYPA